MPLARVRDVIDFQNASYIKLGKINFSEVASQINPLLIEGEQGYLAFKGIRDYVVFTSKRIIAVNIQGITGKKKDYTSLPFAKVQAFSIETAGTFDLDAELDLWFSGLGRVKFEFKGNTDVAYLNKLIAHYVL
jgi:Bacterial PH domain